MSRREIEAKTETGKKLKEYCKTHQKTIGQLALDLGVIVYELNNLIYGKKKSCKEGTIEKLLTIGIDARSEFRARKEGSQDRLFLRREIVGEEKWRQIYEILGRELKERVVDEL